MDELAKALRDYRNFYRAASEIGPRLHTKPTPEK
jgi:hypothetical protein